MTREVLGVDSRTGCPRGDLVTAGDVDHIQLSTSGFLSDKLLGRIVRDMVAIDDVVVPVSIAELESIGALKSESSLPASGLG